MRQSNLFCDYKFCFVCDEPIKVGGIYIGNGLYRHETCAPGSSKWLKSFSGKNSDFREYWLASEKDAKDE